MFLEKEDRYININIRRQAKYVALTREAEGNLNEEALHFLLISRHNISTTIFLKLISNFLEILYPTPFL